MKKLNLFLMDMTNSKNTSGVDRYLHNLIEGVEKYQTISIYRIKLLNDNSMFFCKEKEHSNYVEIVIPLPQYQKHIIIEDYWNKKFNEHVFNLIKHQFNSSCTNVIHIHTLNLIDLALYINSKITCKIITHLHCIPWKGLYNFNIDKFNKLYNLAYLDSSSSANARHLVTSKYEMLSYTDVDHVICVTQCGKDFLLKSTVQRNISVVPNGISELNNDTFRPDKNSNDEFQLLYVGVLSESKGLTFILEAIRKIQNSGFNVTLIVAGSYSPNQDNLLHNRFPDVNINFLGRITYDELKNYYCSCDIGVIASLQEQASYVAIEMAMFGMPIITTAVDGLDEIFDDNVNALKVNTKFSKVFGLTVDVDMLAEKIELLIRNNELRKRLSENARQLYEEKFTLKHMINQTINIYEEISEIKLQENEN